MSVMHRSGGAVIVAGVAGVIAWVVRRSTPRRAATDERTSVALKSRAERVARDPAHRGWLAGVRDEVERGVPDGERLSKADLLKRRNAVRSAS
jgi:hypothetical protein